MTAPAKGGNRGKVTTTKARRPATAAVEGAVAKELAWLRSRVAALDAVVEENLQLTRRIASLEAELDARSNIARTEADEIGPIAVEATDLAVRLAARADIAAIIKQRHERPKARPVVLLVGQSAFCAGAGDTFAHLEIRDLLFGLPNGVSATVLAVRPPDDPSRRVPVSGFLDGLDLINAPWPDREDLTALLDVLAPDIVMNVGPLGPVMELFRHLPAASGRTVILNLVHGECNGPATRGIAVLPAAASALVTTEIERGLLVASGFAGEAVVYRRGVDMARTEFAGVAGNLGLVAILDDANQLSATLTAGLLQRLAGASINVAALGTPNEQTSGQPFDTLAVKRVGDVVNALRDATAILMPPASTGIPQALQVAMAMGKVCFLPAATFSSHGLDELPGIRYPDDEAETVRLVADVAKNPQAYADLASMTSKYARNRLRRGIGRRTLQETLRSHIAPRPRGKLVSRVRSALARRAP